MVWKLRYLIRFEDMTSESTRLKYMTDGMLLRECASLSERVESAQAMGKVSKVVRRGNQRGLFDFGTMLNCLGPEVNRSGEKGILNLGDLAWLPKACKMPLAP